jgi:hypothetical protein
MSGKRNQENAQSALRIWKRKIEMGRHRSVAFFPCKFQLLATGSPLSADSPAGVCDLLFHAAPTGLLVAIVTDGLILSWSPPPPPTVDHARRQPNLQVSSQLIRHYTNFLFETVIKCNIQFNHFGFGDDALYSEIVSFFFWTLYIFE